MHRLKRVTNCAAALTILLATAAADSPYTAVQAQPVRSTNSDSVGPPDTRQLDALLGRDLWKDRPVPRDLALLDRLVGNVPKGFVTEPVPWRIWKTDRNGAPRYIVILAEDLFLIPGGSSACLVVLDAVTLQRRREILCFQTGWRMYPSDATFEFSSDLDDSHLIVLHISRFINGPDISKEYFVLTNDDRLRLIRLEDGKGKAFPNNYLYSNYEIGMVPAAAAPQDWLNLLHSKSRVDVLSVLVFLGGNHIADHPSFIPNRSKYADLFDSLDRNPKIRERIAQLTLSPDPWIREAALLASRKRDRPFQ